MKSFVIPAKAGIQFLKSYLMFFREWIGNAWIPAFAGMTR